MNKKKRLTPVIIDSIRRWKEKENLSYEQIGKICNGGKPLSPTAACQWFNGKSKAIRYYNWKNLFPHIKPYLPDNFIDDDNAIFTQNDVEKEINRKRNGNAIINYCLPILEDEELSDKKKIEIMIRYLKNVIL